MGTAQRTRGRFDQVRAYLGEVYGPDLHAERIDSLAGATLGDDGGLAGMAMIGHALAQARGLVTKHAVKQVDRLLSNDGIDVWDSFARWDRTRSAAAATSWWQWTGPHSTVTTRRRWC